MTSSALSGMNVIKGPTASGFSWSIAGLLARITTYVAHFQNTKTASASAMIDITSGTIGESTLNFSDTSGYRQGAVRYNHSSDELELWSGGSVAVTIDSTGNVGIGTGAPTHKLHVVGDGLFTGPIETNGRAAGTVEVFSSSTLSNLADIVFYNASMGGSYTTFLPSSPLDGQVITFRKPSSTNTWTISRSGSHVLMLNGATGTVTSTTITNWTSRRFCFMTSGVGSAPPNCWHEIL